MDDLDYNEVQEVDDVQEEDVEEKEAVVDVMDSESIASPITRLRSNAYTREFKVIKVSEIAVPEPIKRARKNTIGGLTKSVNDLGVLQPIQVLTVREESQDETYRYVCFQGIRRLYAAMRNGDLVIDAMVNDFKDKDQGMDLAFLLYNELNISQEHDWEEQWSSFQLLEEVATLKPSALERFLQLGSGDAMKFKDVMLCDFEEVKSSLLTGKKDLDGCYKMLKKLRKDEDVLEREDQTSIVDSVDNSDGLTDGIGNEEALDGRMTEEEVKKVLEMNEEDGLDDAESLSFSDITKAAPVEYQDVKNRHPLDKDLRKKVFQRDNYTCQCCGAEGIIFASSLRAHHKIPVHAGGSDSEENLVTVCESCHNAIHTIELNGGKLYVTKDEFDSYTEVQRLRIQRIFKLSKFALNADKVKKISHKALAKANYASTRPEMPHATSVEMRENIADLKRKKREHEKLAKDLIKSELPSSDKENINDKESAIK